MSTLGLDIGTSGCKALVFSDEGQCLAQSRRTYELRHPEPGWAELDPDRVARDCFDVIREAAAASKDPVRGLAISSQGEAFVPVGPGGRALGAAMVSSDTRAAAIAKRWPQDFGEERLYNITGHTPHPLFTLFKLLWLRDHCPDVWRDTRQFLCFEEFLHLRLGVEPTTSWSMAGRTMLFDVQGHRWSEDIMEAATIDPERLGRPRPSGVVVGTLPPSICTDLRLAKDAVAVTGGHDQVCAALGAGALEPGAAMYATGTVECIAATMARPVFTADLRVANLCTYDHAAPGRHATLAYSLTGGNLLAWFRDQWCRSEVRSAAEGGRDAFARILDDLPAEPSGLLVLPYFTPSGTPYFDRTTPGAILGLRLSTTRSQVLRGLLEGVALEMRLNLDLMRESGLDVHTLRAVGGGARSTAWLQLKADVTSRVIERVEVTEAGCLGAAMLAQSALSGHSVQELAHRWIRTSNHIEPTPSTSDHYAETFERYRRLQPSLSGLHLFDD